MTTVPSVSSTWAVARASREARVRGAGSRSLLLVLVAWFGARLPAPRALRTGALRLGGLGAMAGAAWTQGLVWGLLATGVSLLLLEWVTDK